MDTPKSVSQLFPSRFISWWDLGSRAYILTVRDVTIEKMRSTITNQDELKAVVHFVEAQKGLVVNKTQAVALAEIAGSEIFETWKGTRVTLRAGKFHKKDTVLVSAAPSERM